MRSGLWINETLDRKPGSPGREHLISTLEKRYDADIQKLNTVYGKNYQSFDELRKKGGIAYPKGYFTYSKNESIAADQEALIGEIVVRVNQLGHSEIRKVDSNHMILGCYVKGVTYSADLWKRITPYIDVLAPQHFSETHKIKPVVESTGLPALLSDQVFGNVYPETLLKIGQNSWSGSRSLGSASALSLAFPPIGRRSRFHRRLVLCLFARQRSHGRRLRSRATGLLQHRQ